MNTTKRKFNALLQGIGAKSTPSAAPAPAPVSASGKQNNSTSNSAPVIRPSTPTSTSYLADTTTPNKTMAPSSIPTTPSEILTKRRRVGVLETTTANEKTGSTAISNIILKKWTPGGSAASPSKGTKTNEPPKYCPGDRDELIRRLATFQELTEWTPKPDKVNEIEWAKRGWVCHGKERVQCTLCHKELVVRTSKEQVDGKEVTVKLGSDIEEALVKRFVDLIVDAHQEDCLWRKRGCDDSLLRLPLASPPAALAALRQRYDELCARQSFLPYLFNLRLPANLDLQATKSQLSPTFFTEPPPPSTSPTAPNDVAVALALAGWQGLMNPRVGPVPNSATCATCLRRLGLWMFKSKEVDDAGNILVPAPMDYLDPVREHRFFCPWRNATVQHNPGAKKADNKTAWEVLTVTIKNHAYLRAQSEKSTLRSILHRPAASLPATPMKGTQKGGNGGPPTPGSEAVDDEDEDNTARDLKDKERWARLRRVKSLFDTKNGKKLRRESSRHGTESRPPTSHSRQASMPPETSTPKK